MAVILSVPAERSAPPKDLEVRPKQVKAWLESLPLARSSAEAGRTLIAHLAAVNRAKIDADDRAQILEAYRPVAHVLLEEMEAIYAKATLPLPPRARDALTLARTLARELATGCKIAIADRGGKLLGFGAKKQLPLLAMRALEYTAAILKASYRSYTPVPEGVWREMHQLFLFTEQERIGSEIVDGDTKDAPINVYVECLLLSLTDPYRLVPGDVDRVVAQIRSARAPVTLGQQRPGTASGGHFLVPCDTDRPPKPLVGAGDDSGGPNWRLLDANPVVDRLRAKLQAVESGNVSATTRGLMPPEVLLLMEKLVQLWGDPPKRANRRLPLEGSVAIVSGIKAISHFLAQEADDEAQSEGLRRGITMPLKRAILDDDAQMVPIYEYEIVNASTGGLKVRRTGETTQPVAVGEVVGVKQGGIPGWTIGSVRWVTVFEEGGMEFGVQFLARQASVAVVTPTIAASGTQPRQGLFLVGEPDEAFDQALLTPPNTFSELREFELVLGSELTQVRARGLIEKTSRFELFHVSPS